MCTYNGLPPFDELGCISTERKIIFTFLQDILMFDHTPNILGLTHLYGVVLDDRRRHIKSYLTQVDTGRL
jgi:hypothetical protein